jgi:alkylation response protein AidB-like acyl-CoA dehydrogenase
VVNGQKTWSTLAQEANYLYVLVRTDKNAKKQEGISFLLIDAKSPGITIRPIMMFTGDDSFCEIYFDNVRVPKTNLVGGLNKGRTVAKTQLGFERIFLGSPLLPQCALSRLEYMARTNGLFDDPVFTDKFVQLSLDVADHAALCARYMDIARAGKPLPPGVSMLKIVATEAYSRIASLMVEAAGGAGEVEGVTRVGDIDIDVMTHFYYASIHVLRRQQRDSAQHHRPGDARTAGLTVMVQMKWVPAGTVDRACAYSAEVLGRC